MFVASRQHGPGACLIALELEPNRTTHTHAHTNTQEPPPSSETEGEPPRRRGSSTPFDPVLGSLSLSTSIATSAASAAAAATGAATGAVPPRRSTGATSTGTYGPHIHERRSAFRRTFSEEVR